VRESLKGKRSLIHMKEERDQRKRTMETKKQLKDVNKLFDG